MSNSFIDQKYIGIVSTRLRNFQRKHNGISVFTHSCESSTSRKRRAYFLPYKNTVVLKCHHCGVSSSLFNFLKEVDPNLAAEYKMEMFKENIFISKPVIENITKPEVNKESTENLFEDLIPFTKLGKTNPAMKYLSNRKIPESKLNNFYLSTKFYKWASKIESEFLKFKEQVPRLIIPYYDGNKKLLGFACRAFGKEEPKYIQLRINKEAEFLFGLDTIDTTRPIIAVEGQIDSLFLENSIAVGAANYTSKFLNDNKENVIIVPDNDFRRNRQVCDQLKKAINNGYTVSFLPDYWKKDINEIVKSGISQKEIQDYILTHKKNGLNALLELTLERKC